MSVSKNKKTGGGKRVTVSRSGARPVADTQVVKQAWLSAIKSFFKVIICAFATFSLVLAMLFCIVPKAAVPIFHFFGMRGAEEKSYERIYEKSGSTSDLYNLVIYEMEQNNSKKELEYIKSMYKAKDYGQFCEKLNKSGISSANGNKSLYVYVADTNAFLMGQEMKCSVEIGLNEKKSDWQFDLVKLVTNNVSGSNLTENSFNAFISAIYKTDKMTLEDKQILIRLLDLTLTDGNTRFKELVDARLNAIQLKLATNRANAVEKILLTYSKMQWYEGLYYYDLMLNLEETEQGQQYKEAYESARQEYNNLIK